jgi:predicted PurR-regulated permease PerM
LTGVLFLLCLAQIGMLVVLIPAVIWVFWSGDTAAGTLLLVWSLGAAVLDQFLRPILVGRHADLPALLIFIGVVGGLVAFGLLGIFVGPVVLAVAYALLSAWLRGDMAGSSVS